MWPQAAYIENQKHGTSLIKEAAGNKYNQKPGTSLIN